MESDIDSKCWCILLTVKTINDNNIIFLFCHNIITFFEVQTRHEKRDTFYKNKAEGFGKILLSSMQK